MSNANLTALLDDPSIDVVYIPLPAGLHCEWALKAISKGKHVIIEEPATANAGQSERLFRSPLLQQPNAPVLLAAIHFSFQPTWQYFLTLVDTLNIEKVDAIAKLPFYIIPRGGIRFDYKLGGGCLPELGTYPLYALRKIMGDEPECMTCKTRNPPPPHELCDEAADAVFRFPGGRIGNAVIDLRAPITTFPTLKISVLHKEIKIEQPDLPSNQTKWRRRKLVLHNFLISSFWHSIDIEDEYTMRDNTDGKTLKKWTKKKSKKIYTFKDTDRDQPGEPFWNSYRHQLEQFVNRVRGREGSGLWVYHEDSIAQARMIDMTCEKSGLPLRYGSQYCV